jgi:hypothetical protein
MIHEREAEEFGTVCADCAGDLGVDPTLFYDAGNGARLCWECALRRGGIFDAERDEWAALPDVSDLPDERRQHP